MKFVWRPLSIFSMSLVLFVLGCTGPGSQHMNADALEKLEPQQKFILKDLNDNAVSLETVLKQNKAVLVNFWATWCPPCREEIPGLIRLQEKFKGRSFTILGVDAGESQKKVSSFAEKAGINYPVLLDSNMAVTEKFKVFGIPTSYLVASDGRFLGEYHSYSSELVEDVEKALK